MPTIEAVLDTQTGSASWITMAQRIAQEIHKSNEKDFDYIKLAMCSAMAYYRNHRFPFNEADGWLFELIDGQQTYEKGATMDYVKTDGVYEVGEIVFSGPPEDMVMPITTYCKVGGTRWMDMGVTTMEDIRYLTPTTDATGYPEWYAWFDDAMHFHPIPEGGNVSTVRLDYVKDIGVPTYRWNGTGWSFFHPRGATLSDSWTSPWLEERYGGELIRARAKWDLYYNVYHDTENAMMQAEHTGLALKHLRKTQMNLNHRLRRMPIRL